MEMAILVSIWFILLGVRWQVSCNNYIQNYDNALNVCLSLFSAGTLKQLFRWPPKPLGSLFQDISEGWPHKYQVHVNIFFQIFLWPFLIAGRQKANQYLQWLLIIPLLVLLLLWLRFTPFNLVQVILIYSLLGSTLLYAREGFAITIAAVPVYILLAMMCFSFSQLFVPLQIGSGIFFLLILVFGMYVGKQLLEAYWRVPLQQLIRFFILFMLVLLVLGDYHFCFPNLAFFAGGLLFGVVFFSYSGLLFTLMGVTVFSVLALFACYGFVLASQMLLNQVLWFVLGLGILPVLFEFYFRLLKWRGYPYKTFLQFFFHANQTAGQNITLNDVYAAKKNHNIRNWQFIQLFYSLEGAVFTGLIGLGVIYSFLHLTLFNVLILFQFFYGIYTWMTFPSGKSSRYFYNQFYFSLPFIIANGLQFFPWALQWLILVAAFIELFINRRWLFSKTAFTKSIQWLEQQGARRVFGVNFYPLNLIFGRANVRYAPNTLEEMRELVAQGYYYWHVDWQTDFAIFDNQLALLEQVESTIEPAYQVKDDFFEHIATYWMYLGEAAVTPAWDRGTSALSTKKREFIKIYDLSEFLQRLEKLNGEER